MTTEILYFGNPMCSWCWGFAPVLSALRDEFASDLTINIGLGSLRQETKPMSTEQKQYVKNHWVHVVERTGQTFNFDFFDRTGFAYDDRSPATAVAAVRQRDPSLALDLFHDLQAAFYRDNRDITSHAQINGLLQARGLDPDDIRERSDRIEIGNEYHETARLGVNGYPTLLALQNGSAQMLSLGYSDWSDVRARLVALME